MMIWQMWFAALGSYQHQPWVISLVDRVLEGSPAVLALLDRERYPFRRLDEGRAVLLAPRALRANLYRYDLQRSDTPWNTRLINCTGPVREGTWWRRSVESTVYLGGLEKDNPSVKAWLARNGWLPAPAKPGRPIVECTQPSALGASLDAVVQGIRALREAKLSITLIDYQYPVWTALCVIVAGTGLAAGVHSADRPVQSLYTPNKQ
jgi:hypothetical protein